MIKLNKKLVSVILSSLVVFGSSAGVFADSQKSGKSNKNTEKTLLEAKEIVTKIANGGETLVGGGVPFDYPVKNVGTVSPLWESGGVNHTHQYILARALIILENDKGQDISDYYYSSNGSNILLEYSDKPDDDENDLLSYRGHFYDPDTGENYLGQSDPTALTRMIAHANEAKKNYWSNRTLALQELGRAIHYLEDVNESHHAANYISVITNHSEYESWVDTNRTVYAVTSSSLYTLLNPTNFDTGFQTYVTDIVKDSATYAKSYIALASYNQDNFKYINWDTAASATMGHAQEIVAAFLYNFLKSVGQIS